MDLWHCKIRFVRAVVQPKLNADDVGTELSSFYCFFLQMRAPLDGKEPIALRAAWSIKSRLVLQKEL